MHLSTVIFQPASALLRSAVAMLFPPRCVGCETYCGSEEFLCKACHHAAFPVESPLCPICGEPRTRELNGSSGVDSVCGRCAQKKPHYTRARAPWEYTGSIGDAIQRAKYGGQLWVLRSIARELGPWLAAELQRIEELERAETAHLDGMDEPHLLLTTVPMHLADLRKRGFDLPYLLLRLSLKTADARYSVDTILQKNRRTPAQAGLDFEHRQINLRRAFSCTAEAQIAGRAVVLFDDVLTTGATANEAARTLKKAGAARVYVLSAARAVAH